MISESIARDNGVKLSPTDDKYYLVYDTCSHIYHDEGEKIGFAIQHGNMIYFDLGRLIGDTKLYMNYYKHPSESELNMRFDSLCEQCSDWIKRRIRGFMTDIKGNFFTDKLETEMYFQRRKSDTNTDYDYIVNDWSKVLNDKEPITWVDFMSEGRIFISLN